MPPMNTSAPMIRIELIDRSVRCFVMGLFGLLPVIGIPLAIASMRQHWRIRQIQDALPNPAHRYLYWGIVFSRVAVALMAIEITITAAIITMASR